MKAYNAIKHIIEKALMRNYIDVDWPWYCRITISCPHVGNSMLIRTHEKEKDKAIENLINIFCEVIEEGFLNEK
jgi:hypothetical protein